MRGALVAMALMIGAVAYCLDHGVFVGSAVQSVGLKVNAQTNQIAFPQSGGDWLIYDQGSYVFNAVTAVYSVIGADRNISARRGEPIYWFRVCRFLFPTGIVIREGQRFRDQGAAQNEPCRLFAN